MIILGENSLLVTKHSQNAHSVSFSKTDIEFTMESEKDLVPAQCLANRLGKTDVEHIILRVIRKGV